MQTKLMAAIALVLVSLSILPATGRDKSANTLPPAQYPEPLKAREAVWKAWFANDRATLEKFLPEDTLAINNGEEQWEGRAEVLETAKQFADDGGKLIRLSFPRVEVQTYGNVAVLYSLWSTET